MPHPTPTVALSADQTADLLGAIGAPSMGSALLLALAPALRCAHLSAFVFDAQLQLHQVMADSVGGSSVAERAGQMARTAGLHRVGPNTHKVGAAQASGDEVLITRRRASDSAPSDPSLALFTRFTLADRMSLLARSGEHWFELNLSRDQQVGEFEGDALAFREAHARLLAALLRRHFESRPPPAWHTAVGPDNAALEQRLALLRSPTERAGTAGMRTRAARHHQRGHRARFGGATAHGDHTAAPRFCQARHFHAG